MRERVVRSAAILALQVALLAACAPDAPPPDEGGGPLPNLLLVSIDSLRADHLASYGYHRTTSPNLDRLAEEGVLFETMVADSSWTLPSHLTMLTGLSSWAHGAIVDTRRLGDGVVTIAEQLRAHGYRTEGFASGPYLHAVFGFDRGFDHYELVGETIYDRSGVTLEKIAGSPALREALDAKERALRAARTSDVLARKVEEAVARSTDGPFFVFVHMFDVHYDYAAPEAYWRRFNPDYAGDLTGRGFMEDPRIHPGMLADELAQLMALYDGEILWTDEHLGRMLDALDAYGVADRTLVAVISDHGEEFFDHGRKGHRATLYDEQLLVPFVLRWPAVLPAGRRIGAQARMIDVAPTLLDLLGVPGIGEGGRSLAATARGDVEGEDLPAMSFLYVEPVLTRTLRLPEEKLEVRVPLEQLTTEGAGAVAYFDLASDPGEQRPVSEDPERLRRLFEDGFEAEDRARRRAASGDGTSVALPPGLRSALEALGYAEPAP